MTQIYKQIPIPGKALEKILPKGCALVLEGGGTRGFYSAGVFEAFIDAGIMFPYIIGVSAGAANVLSYISGQSGRNRQIVEKYVGNPKYVSKRNLLFHRSFFGMKFIFHEVPQKHVFLDWEMFNKQDITLLTGALDCNTGQTVWFNKSDVTPMLEATMASCSVPLLSPIFKFRGYKLLDGGIADPIPIEKSVSDGNTFHVIVLTRNKGYQKSVFKYKNILKLFYSKYPKLIEAILNRHTIYNRQLALCEQLEKEGKAIIIRPLKPLKLNDSTGRDIAKILELYDEGHEEAKEKINLIKMQTKIS
ncbi:MAG: patatin family protein [Spirochaetaceae bacterium]|nr:patatin family protein [Spirochaetaceae bacterium]